MVPIRTPKEIKKLRLAGQLAAEVLMALEQHVEPGVSTAELDAIAYKIITDANAEPAFLGYMGYPATLCVSINEEVVHGIPSKKRVLEDGDIVSVDVGVILKGYYGDNARTYPVGTISDENQRLLDVTHESLLKGLQALRADEPLGLLSHAVQTVAESNGFSVVRAFVGHGIGDKLHDEPQVPNFGRAEDGPIIRAGTVLAVEPMVNAGTHRVKTLSDGWTVITADKKPSAHFEHTVVVLSDGIEILTPWDSRAADYGLA
ncbi:MAG: type I methionyl aminopeptidase [Candidatus Poribacteria bacterium]|nr:type I methionyl aminopeptidase [Candidatus Poribacteria bacterium]